MRQESPASQTLRGRSRLNNLLAGGRRGGLGGDIESPIKYRRCKGTRRKVVVIDGGEEHGPHHVYRCSTCGMIEPDDDPEFHVVRKDESPK